MRKENRSVEHYNSIITVDPSELKSYIFQNNEIKLNKLSGFKRDNFYISILDSRYLITDFIELSNNIADEDIQSAIEIQVYDELNFDPALEYTILYKEYFGTENNDKRIFNIFAIETEKLKSTFKDVIEKNKYLDYIVPEPLIFKSLYNRNMIEKDSVDCFLYFRKKDAILSIYAYGDYVYSKTISFSIEKMHEKFCEITGENIQYDDFTNFIKTGKSINISEENQQLITKLYKEVFVYINDIIFYAKRAYKIDVVDKVFINSSIGIFKNIDRYIRTYVDIEPHELNCKIAKNSKEVKNEQLHNLMIISALDYIEDPENGINFSIFKRPPPFKERPSGKIIFALVASCLISLLYPAYLFGYAYFMKVHLIQLRKNEHKLYAKANNIKSQLDKVNKEKSVIQKKVDNITKKLTYKEKLLNQIYNKKIHYPMKVNLLVGIFKQINKNHSKIYNVIIHNNKKTNDLVMVFSVFSKKDKYITELIKSLAQEKRFGIRTKEIKKDNKKHIYLSDIKVVLHDNI